ncbi:MAG: N-acetylglucosamine kinase [Pyrinomonadaceae bacterium]
MPRPAPAPGPRKNLSTHALTLGVDGGGTKTQAVIADEKGRVVGEGLAGPSNPLRVGVSHAAAAVREAFNRALSEAGARRSEVAAAQVGLAGVRREDLRQRMREELSSLGVASVEVVTDADIALYGATNGEPGLVLIAGTGSICCGKSARGRHACAGGWGPLAGDEGGGSWIARRALQAAARATDGRGRATALVEACLEYFNVAKAEDLSTAIYSPAMTNEHLAGFGRPVIEAARRGDEVAREIVRDAGRELAATAIAVIEKLRMGRDEFQVAHVGGVFKAGEMVLAPLRQEISRVAPGAYLAPPRLPPVVAAARMARAQLPSLALAG